MAKLKKNESIVGYDYSTQEAREETVNALFQRARTARTAQERLWRKYNNYYNFSHEGLDELRGFLEEQGINWEPTMMPDAWAIVESQVNPNVPEPEFRGRDDDKDSAKAKQRQYAVQYIAENNRIIHMNTRNERRLLKYGDAFWKVYWDSEMRCGIQEGDIHVKDIPVQAVYPDPSVGDGTINDGQFVDYVYRMHKVEFARIYGTAIAKRGLDVEQFMGGDYMAEEGDFDISEAVDDNTDTVQILEHWFRQPKDGKEKGTKFSAGAVACSIQANGKEIKYVPTYWKKCGKQCKLFPFVHYWRVQDENSFWNKSELFPIINILDAADRKMALAEIGEALMGSDMIVLEEGALADGGEITNEPGATILMKPGKANSIRRLGGVQSVATGANAVEYYKALMERASRSYETSRGKETERTSTATGLAMIRADAESQQDIKLADRNAGFERLYELMDWSALEYFDDDRLLYLGINKNANREEPIEFRYNSDMMSSEMPAVLDLQGNIVRESWTYFPRVDVTITAQDSVVKGKQATLEALQVLTASQITADNWKLYAAQLDILDIPGKQDIIEDWKQKFSMPAVPETGADATPGTGTPGMAGYQGAGAENSIPSTINGIETMI